MKYFDMLEFRCPCCGKVTINADFLKLLDKARDLAGIPFIINSGYRCWTHNKIVGGSANSSHLKGLAVDIRARTSNQKYLIVKSLLDVGISRIGISDKYIHTDVDRAKDREVLWRYLDN